jgi:hypothetical protein
VVRHPDDTSTDRSRWQGDETSLARRQLADFVHAWQEDADAPQLHNFLPAEPPELRQFTLVELIKLDLEYRWQSGLRKTLPDYIAEFPELGSSPPADLIHEEYLVRKRAGDEVSWEEYRTLYPDRMQELTRLFGGRGTNTVAMQQLGSERTVPGSWVEPGHVVDDFEVLLRNMPPWRSSTTPISSASMTNVCWRAMAGGCCICNTCREAPCGMW